jgi:hypothetical protein
VRKAAAALAAMAGAFLLAAPYTVLDLPNFLNGLASQLARFSTRGPTQGEPPWLLYVKHLSLAGWFWIPLAVTGVAVVFGRKPLRRRWAAPVALLLVYFYVLATHRVVFGRYALPLLPTLCLLSAMPVVEAARLLGRMRSGGWRHISHAVFVLGTLVLTTGFAAETIRWLGQSRREDTRQAAVSWMMANLPRGAKIAVENSGPTYLRSAGFDVGPVELLVDHPAEWYAKAGCEYLVISSTDERQIAPYLKTGPVVFEIAPGARRWGPPIRIVRMTGPT